MRSAPFRETGEGLCFGSNEIILTIVVEYNAQLNCGDDGAPRAVKQDQGISKKDSFRGKMAGIMEAFRYIKEFIANTSGHSERHFVEAHKAGIAHVLIERGYAPSAAEKEAIVVSRRAYQVGGELALPDMESGRLMARSMGASTLASGLLLAGLGWEMGFVASCALISAVGVGGQIQGVPRLNRLENDLEIMKGQKDPSVLGCREFEKYGTEILRNSGFLPPKKPLGSQVVSRLMHRPTAE